MTDTAFRFKQFTIRQERCAMKAGTDSVLLGAWADFPQEGQILDIGTGTGILALMAAQRTRQAFITGIEIDAAAAGQARDNAAASAWSNRIGIIDGDFNIYAGSTTDRYDSLVSNPPYFEHSLLPHDAARTTARHTTTLNYKALFALAKRLLLPQGNLSLVMPAGLYRQVNETAMLSGWGVSRLTFVRTTPRKMPKRILCEWRVGHVAPCQPSTLTIEDAPGHFSDEYRNLTGSFYLKF